MTVYRYHTRVAWSDTDAAQVAHFSNYFRFFEKAEQELYNELGVDPFNRAEGLKIWLPRVEAHCEFLSPCRLNDLLEVELTASKISVRSIRYEFRIHNLATSKAAAEGYVVVVSASISEPRSVPIPDAFSSALKAYFGSGDRT